MVKTGEWLSKGWELVSKDLGTWVVVALIFMVIQGTGIGWILAGPLMCTVFYMMLKSIRTGEKANFSDFAKGFEVFVQALLAWLVSTILTSIGTALCIIPGLVLATGYLFIYPLVMDKGMDFWTAMETSRQKVFEEFFGFLGFAIVCGLIAVLGAFCLGVGILIAFPVIAAAQAYAYEDLFGGPTTPPASAA